MIKILSVIFFAFFMIYPVSSAAKNVEALKAGVVKIIALLNGNQRIGTGFIWHLTRHAAYVVTASHVVEGAGKLEVEFHTRRNQPIPAEVVQMEGGDPRGLAVLFVEGEIPYGSSILNLVNSDDIIAEGPARIIGFNRESGVPWGVIAGEIVGREGRFWKFTGRVGEGNSGGPLIKGDQVIGMVTERTGQIAYASTANNIVETLTGWKDYVPQRPQLIEAKQQPKIPRHTPPDVGKVSSKDDFYSIPRQQAVEVSKEPRLIEAKQQPKIPRHTPPDVGKVSSKDDFYSIPRQQAVKLSVRQQGELLMEFRKTLRHLRTYMLIFYDEHIEEFRQNLLKSRMALEEHRVEQRAAEAIRAIDPALPKMQRMSKVKEILDTAANYLSELPIFYFDEKYCRVWGELKPAFLREPSERCHDDHGRQYRKLLAAREEIAGRFYMLVKAVDSTQEAQSLVNEFIQTGFPVGTEERVAEAKEVIEEARKTIEEAKKAWAELRTKEE